MKKKTKFREKYFNMLLGGTKELLYIKENEFDSLLLFSSVAQCFWPCWQKGLQIFTQCERESYCPPIQPKVQVRLANVFVRRSANVNLTPPEQTDLPNILLNFQSYSLIQFLIAIIKAFPLQEPSYYEAAVLWKISSCLITFYYKRSVLFIGTDKISSKTGNNLIALRILCQLCRFVLLRMSDIVRHKKC